jgi:hypothetical protein
MAFADTLAWAQAQAAGTAARALADAYATGTLRVSVEGRSVEYRSLPDLERALSALHAAATPAATRRPAKTIAQIGARNGGW